MSILILTVSQEILTPSSSWKGNSWLTLILVGRCYGNLTIFFPSDSKIESLKNCMAWFKIALLEVYSLDESMAMLS